MGRLLKEMFGVRAEDVTVRVPDADMPGLQRAVLSAVKSGDLPKTALKWARSSDAVDRDAEKEKGSQKEPEAKPEVPAARKADPKVREPKAKAEPAKKAVGKDPALAKTVAAEPAVKAPAPRPPSPRIDTDDDWFPSFPQPKSAVTQVEPEEPEYRSPFGHLGLGGSSWEAKPRWMSDPEHMPVPGSKGGSQPVPGSRDREASAARGPSPVGRPWTDKDVGRMGKRPGLLSRIFGRKGSK